MDKKTDPDKDRVDKDPVPPRVGSRKDWSRNWTRSKLQPLGSHRQRWRRVDTRNPFSREERIPESKE